MLSIKRWILGGLLAASALLAAWFCWTRFAPSFTQALPQSQSGSWFCDLPVHAAGDGSPGNELHVSFALHNRSTRPQRVLGSDCCCGLRVRFGEDPDALPIVPAGGQVVGTFDVDMPEGPFEREVTLFLEASGAAGTLTIRLQGNALGLTVHD
jgi:hypothetical protein